MVKETWQRASRRQRVMFVVGLIYVSYAVLGYFLLSPLVRKEIISQLASLTGREVQLERFTFNPIGLAVTAEGFALKDPDGQDFVAFDEFYADFELSSLFRWSWHFDEIVLAKPRIRVTQESDQSFNFDDIVARLDATEDAPADTEMAADDQDAGGIPAISIGEFHLDTGDFVFRDEARSKPDEIAFNELSFDVLDFATAGSNGDNNSYTFEVTGPDGGHFLWEGNLDFDPLVADGQLALAGLRLSPLAEFAAENLNFSIPEGELDIETKYRFESGDELILSLSDGLIRLRDLQLDDRRTEARVLALPELVLSGISMNTVASSAGIAEIRITKPVLQMRMTDQGLDLESLFTPIESEATATPVATATEDVTETRIDDGVAAEVEAAAGDAIAPWQVMIDAVVLDQMQMKFRDETLTEPAEVELAPLSVTAKNVSPNVGKTFSFDGSAVINQQGQLGFTGDGELAPLRVATALTLADLPLTMATAWLNQSVAVQLPSGTLNSDLNILAQQQAEEVTVSVTGSSAINNFAMQERTGAAIVAFAGLNIDGISMDTGKNMLLLGNIDFERLSLNVVTDDQARTVADRILVPVAAAADDGSGDDWRVQIGKLGVNNAELETLDQSISPNFRFGIYQLSGAMTNLDSQSKKSATLDFNAKVDKYAPLSISGTLNPLAAKPQADVKVKLDGYEMTSLTPFTGQYLGYAVSSGQLNFDTEVLLDDTYLDSKNRIHAANFFLGDKVESEEALRAPIKLGLSVLRNREGVIELSVGAKGDLSDPSVSARGIILKALGNVLVKAATSPFSMLAGLAGGADLSSIPFEPGSDQLSSAGRSSLQQLVTVLEKRPSLQFSLAGSAVTADRTALAESSEGQLLAGSDWQNVATAVAERSFRRRLQKRYQEVTGQSPDQFVLAVNDGMTDAQKDQAEQQQAVAIWDALIAVQQDNVSADQLQLLASQRAQNVKTVLVEELQQDGARLFIANPVIEGDQAAQGVVLGLAGN